MENETLICSADAVDVSGVPKEIKILPLGYVHSRKGDFQVDDESVQLILKKFNERKIDMVIDYEHQTLFDMQAPAAGWIKKLKKGTDAILAEVEWTEKAKEYLKNKEYRYISPVVCVRESDKKAIRMDSNALTNSPAIDGMYAVVNSDRIGVAEKNISTGGTKMDFKLIAKLLGLPDTATEADVEKALAEAIAKKDEKEKEKSEGEKPEDVKVTDPKEGEKTEVVANSTILNMLGLDKKAKTEDVAASIMSLKAGEVDVKTELLTLKSKMNEREADELVTLALHTGKIDAAQKEWAKDYALKDASGFRGFLDKAPVVVPMEKLVLKDAPAGSLNTNEYDVKVLKSCGVSAEDVKKYYKSGEE